MLSVLKFLNPYTLGLVGILYAQKKFVNPVLDHFDVKNNEVLDNDSLVMTGLKIAGVILIVGGTAYTVKKTIDKVIK